MQLKDTLRMFNGLVERCFSECVTGFRSKSLTGPEEKCVTVCANKYLKHSVSASFTSAAARVLLADAFVPGAWPCAGSCGPAFPRALFPAAGGSARRGRDVNSTALPGHFDRALLHLAQFESSRCNGMVEGARCVAVVNFGYPPLTSTEPSRRVENRGGTKRYRIA
eukprot:scaffold920_cov135-Isochrysis_galbana.AAC.10